MSSTISSSTSFSLKILTALIGSPTYFGLANLTVFTRPAPWTSRHGMMRGRSMSDFREILQKLYAPLMTFFGMELHAENIARVDA